MKDHKPTLILPLPDIQAIQRENEAWEAELRAIMAGVDERARQSTLRFRALLELDDKGREQNRKQPL